MSEKENELVDLVVETVEEEYETVETIPHETSKEWYDFLIEKLYDHELVNGHPTTDGLRRFTQAYYGEIVSSETTQSEILLDNYGARAIATHKIHVRKYSNNDLVSASASVDAHEKSLPHPYNQHILSTVDTKAEGKALRRLLKVRIVTHEEVQSGNEDEQQFNTHESINDQQIMAVSAMCRKYNLNVEKVTKNFFPNINRIKQLKNIEACSLIDSITALQRLDNLPEDLTGYEKSWAEHF